MKRKTLSSTTTHISPPSYITRDFPKLKKDIRVFVKKLLQRISSNNQLSSLTTTGGNKKKLKTLIPVALLIVVIGIILLSTAKLLDASSKTKQDERATVKGPKASVTLNKEFSFPITDAKGKEVTKLKYTIEDAELRDEIVVKGTRAVAIKGRTFLIFSIKLGNEYDKSLQINAQDYIRLVVNGNDKELIAADIHNDPVVVQPISTKVTRLGFPINDTDKNLVIKVGEIKGEKQDIQLTF